MIEARETLENKALDPAFIAEAVLLPSEAFIGDHMAVVDPEAINRAREALRAALGTRLEDFGATLMRAIPPTASAYNLAASAWRLRNHVRSAISRLRARRTRRRSPRRNMTRPTI